MIPAGDCLTGRPLSKIRALPVKKMAKLIHHLAARLRALVVNRREAERREAEVEARLLLSISLAQGGDGAGPAAPGATKLIGSTCNVSETGLAMVLPSLRIGQTLITEEGCGLRIVLDIYPAGLVEIDAALVHHRRLEEKEARAGHLVGVRITGMNETDRIRYLAYLAQLERRGPTQARAV
jgi:PilZ domain